MKKGAVNVSTEKTKTIRLTILASIPIVLAILEAVLWFTNSTHNPVAGGWTLEGSFAFVAVMGFFFLPFFCLILLIVSFVLSLKEKQTLFVCIFTIEFLLDLIAIFFSAHEFYYALSI